MSIDLLDQENPKQKKFKKNFILIPLAILTMLAYLIHIVHWPGGTIFYIFFGALTSGFCFGLLFKYKQFSFTAKLSIIALPLVTILFLQFVNIYGLSLFGIISLIALLISVLLLRNWQVE